MRERIFQLCYHQHGGSGLNFSYSEVMGMGIDEMDWYCERLSDQRSEEARKMKSRSK